MKQKRYRRKKMNNAGIETEKEGEFSWLNAHHWSVWLGNFCRLFCHWFMSVFKRSRVNIHISNFEWNKISVFHWICVYHLIFSLFSGIESSEYPESKKETEEENEIEGEWRNERDRMKRERMKREEWNRVIWKCKFNGNSLWNRQTNEQTKTRLNRETQNALHG